ncbi:MAG TPA: alpha/beta fold hydrolase [Solirubrobacteraceae bacterium]
MRLGGPFGVGGARRGFGGLGGLAVTIVALLGGGPGSGVAVAAGPAACAYGTLAGDQSITLTADGLAREAVLHVPSSPAGTALPLIVAFHGYGGSGAEFARDTGLSTLADKEGFAVVYPSSHGPQWAISGGERDVLFTSALLDRVEAVACVDPARVYATGVSIGAGMAARAGCELSARIAGLVLVSGGYRSLPACNPDRPLSILEIHGTADTTVPYAGRGASRAGAVLPYVVGWATRDRCGPTPTHSVVARHTLRYEWTGCAWGTIVEHLRIYGGKHGLPNAVGAEISSGDTSSIDGAYEIWHFLASRKLALPFAALSVPAPAAATVPAPA